MSKVVIKQQQQKQKLNTEIKHNTKILNGYSIQLTNPLSAFPCSSYSLPRKQRRIFSWI